ncbi:MAG: hypothetical protein QOF76_3558 [Solirubrobacteraceae bacterium]|nr:hypothetical protein [Solirubrobacteraceae bacterium]
MIERAALLSAGGAFDDAVEWIRAHGGTAEYAVAARGARSGMSSMGGTEAAEKMPLRFVLPAGALESQSSM